MLFNTQTLTKLIADVWFARADVAEAKPWHHPQPWSAASIPDAMTELRTKSNANMSLSGWLTAYKQTIPRTDTINKLLGRGGHSTMCRALFSVYPDQNTPTRNFDSGFGSQAILVTAASGSNQTSARARGTR